MNQRFEPLNRSSRRQEALTFSRQTEWASSRRLLRGSWGARV